MRRFVLALYALLMASMSLEAVMPPLLPTFKGDLGLSTLETSALLAVPWFVMFALSLPIGALSDRFGARAVTLVGGGIAAVAGVVQGLAPGFGALLAGRAIYGAAIGIMWTAGIAWIAARADTRAVGGTSAAAALGFVVGPVVGGTLAEHVGIAAPFLLYAGAAALATAVLAAQADTGAAPSETRAPLRRSLRAAPREPRVAGAAVMVLLSGLGGGAVNLLVPLGLGANGFSPGEIGSVFSAMSVLFTGLSVVAARGGDRLVTVRVAGAGLAVAAAVFLLPVASGASVALVAFVLLTAPFSRALLSTITYPLAVSGARRAGLPTGAVLGLVNLAWSCAATLGPVVAGALAEAAGRRGAFVVVLAAFALAGTWMLSSSPRTGRGDGGAARRARAMPAARAGR